MNQGILQGITQGIEQNRIEIAKKLLKLGLSIHEICEATSLSVEEVENLS